MLPPATLSRRLLLLCLIVTLAFAVRALTANFLRAHLDDPGWFPSGIYAQFDRQAQNWLDGRASIFWIDESSRTDGSRLSTRLSFVGGPYLHAERIALADSRAECAMGPRLFLNSVNRRRGRNGFQLAGRIMVWRDRGHLAITCQLWRDAVGGFANQLDCHRRSLDAFVGSKAEKALRMP